jgi:hypothetical protein
MSKDVYESLPGFIGNRPASKAAIEEVERTLGLEFAADYKAMLADCGRISANGHELTGISSSARLDVTAVTEWARAEYANLPAAAYVIEDAHIDGILVCQDVTGEVFQVTPRGGAERLAPSLIEYLQL